MVEQRKRELVIQLAKARGEIDQGREDMRQGLSLPMQFKRLLMRPQVKWIAGSLGAVALYAIFRKKPKTAASGPPQVGFFRWSLGVMFALIRPSLSKLIIDRFQSEVENRLPALIENRGLAHPSKSDLSQ